MKRFKPPGTKIKEAREELGLSLSEFHTQTGIHLSTLSLYENNQRLPNDINLKRLAGALKVTIDWLLESDADAQETNRDHIYLNNKMMQYILADTDFWKGKGIYPPTEKERSHILSNYKIELKTTNQKELKLAYCDMVKFILLRIRDRDEVKP